MAVEPLEASGEPDVRNLAGLVTAQLAATLGRAPGLRVVLFQPRSSSVSAEALERVRVGVRWTLQGTVFLSGEDVAVTLTMTEAPAGRVAWTATAKGRFDQVLSLASRMASEAGGAAGAAVAAGRLDFPDRETFEDFVRADRALSSYDPSQLDTAVTLFSRCVERAPSFAPSYPRLGFSLLQYRNLGVDYDPAILDRAHAVIRKGLAVDPGNPQLVLALGWFRLYTYDFARAHEAVAQLAALPSGADLGCKLALWDEFYRGEPKAVTETLPALSRPPPVRPEPRPERRRPERDAGPARGGPRGLARVRGHRAVHRAPRPGAGLAQPRPGTCGRRGEGRRGVFPAAARPDRRAPRGPGGARRRRPAGVDRGAPCLARREPVLPRGALAPVPRPRALGERGGGPRGRGGRPPVGGRSTGATATRRRGSSGSTSRSGPGPGPSTPRTSLRSTRPGRLS